MGGTAWQKVLAEYPAFTKTFNEAFYLNPSISGDIPALIALAQSVIDNLAGQSNATVEGRSFAEWFRRQFILETNDTLGLKLLVQPIPLPPEPGTSDFGVFLVQATYFETRPGGDEILLSGVSFPIFWSFFFDRIFPSSQEDRMDIGGAYGSVAPNLPNLHAGQPYRCAVDIPVQDRIARCYLPSGAVATGSNPNPRDFYGTVIGVPGGTGVTIRIRLTVGLTVIDDIPVTNGAFGALIGSSEFLGYQRLRVEVIRREFGLDTVVIDRRVNKGPGPIGLDMRLGDGDATFSPAGGLPKGLSTLGFAVDPYSSLAGQTLGINEGEVLAARWNGSRARYDIYPDTGALVHGNGYFVRMENAQPGYSIVGRTSPGVPIGVALRPGWNLVACPLGTTTPVIQVRVVHSTNFPKDWSEAVGIEIGTEFFEFTPGVPDAATGAPETGTMTAATSFVPGKAYFVRVLVAEGVTLLFSPTSGTQSFSALAPPHRYSWLVQLTLQDGKYQAVAEAGQTYFGRRGWDPAMDSGLPPSMVGLQLVIEHFEPLYRDIRQWNAADTYMLKAVGLVPGRMYSLRFDYLYGMPLMARLKDGLTFVNVRRNYVYTFRATSTTRTITYRVNSPTW
jgi:hypothetical protein